MSRQDYSHKARGPLLPRGIVCPSCGGTAWEIKRSRPVFGTRTRWRVCKTEGCGQEIRTHEAIVQVYPRETDARNE